MKEVIADIDRWRAAGRRVALARVIGIEGSGPRRPGGDDGCQRGRRGVRLSLGRLRRGRRCHRGPCSLKGGQAEAVHIRLLR